MTTNTVHTPADSEPEDSSPVMISAEMNPDSVTTESLESLQNEDQRKIMDIVDRLRRIGLSGIVGLPQLVVCGDQSSGKSSVLEAITEIPFPRKENLCTRFATQITMRREFESSITTTIMPDGIRPQEEKDKLLAFRRSIADFSQLPEIIEEATTTMGLGKVGESRAFSRDVLSIDIAGPKRPQLTLVDLPGLIHATNKAQTEHDKELILSLVQEYMKNPRTIILAVVSAKNDFANQVILNHCKKIDEDGRRTLGIITKPDYLREGSDNELAWLELAQNKDIYFERGWHILKNRSEDEIDFSFSKRNGAEREFFSKGRYRELPRDTVGIEALRARLSTLLQDHLVKELPQLKSELVAKLRQTNDDLQRLGEKRSSLSEQRQYLTNVSMMIYDILKSAVKGYYDHAFFGSVNMNAAVVSIENIKRFRAVIQYLNIEFANNMRLRGHRYAIAPGPRDETVDSEGESSDPTSSGWEEDDELLPTPSALSRKDAIAWVQKVLQRSRGCELPGNFNPMLISQLFWEQSQPWEAIALEHIERVAEACKDFVSIVLGYSASAEIQTRLASVSMDTALEAATKASQMELAKIVQDKRRHPMTYNHYYTTTIQKQRQKKHEKTVRKAKEPFEVEAFDNITYPTTLTRRSEASIEKDMDKFCADEALDSQRAYYKDELKYFIHAVTKQVIERHLVEPLPDKILSPPVIAGLSDEDVAYVAAEPKDVTTRREHLEDRKATLGKGLKIFKEAMGGLKH